MSSAEFMSIFDHAAAVVQARCGGLTGTASVLQDFRRRIDTDQLDPLVNRELIVEPRMDSQRLEVPVETVERVAEELHNLHVLHIWARALCPNVDPDEDLTIVETDLKDTFHQALEGPCPHCGQHHMDLSWDCIETFYAFHFDAQPDQFRVRDFFAKAPA